MPVECVSRRHADVGEDGVGRCSRTSANSSGRSPPRRTARCRRRPREAGTLRPGPGSCRRPRRPAARSWQQLTREASPDHGAARATPGPTSNRPPSDSTRSCRPARPPVGPDHRATGPAIGRPGPRARAAPSCTSMLDLGVAGVLDRVRDGLADDEVRRRLDLGRPPEPALVPGARSCSAATRMGGEPARQRGGDPCVLEDRRPDPVHQLAEVRDRGRHLVTDVAQGPVAASGFRVTWRVASSVSDRIATSCCCTPSCRSRSMRRRTPSSASESRVRDAASSRSRTRARREMPHSSTTGSTARAGMNVASPTNPGTPIAGHRGRHDHNEQRGQEAGPASTGARSRRSAGVAGHEPQHQQRHRDEHPQPAR